MKISTSKLSRWPIWSISAVPPPKLQLSRTGNFELTWLIIFKGLVKELCPMTILRLCH